MKNLSSKILIITTSILVIAIIIGGAWGVSAQTDIFKEVCDDVPKSSKDPVSPVCEDATATAAKDLDKGNPVSGPSGTIQKAANILAGITGIVAVVMIIISGLVFITAGGTGFKTASGAPTRAAQARSTLLYSVIGLAIVAAAWTIVTFVINNLINT